MFAWEEEQHISPHRFHMGIMRAIRKISYSEKFLHECQFSEFLVQTRSVFTNRFPSDDKDMKRYFV